MVFYVVKCNVEETKEREMLVQIDAACEKNDFETAYKIIQLLKDITNMGTAVIITTHNIPLLDKFPGIVYRCKDGLIKDVTNEYNHLDLTEDAETGEES